MRQRFHKAITVLLSGAVLASSVLPPAVCHAHVGGDREHSHHDAEADHHADVHPGHDRHHDGEADQDEHSHHSVSHNDRHRHDDGRDDEHEIESPAAHLHFSIAGFDFSLPLPVDEHSNGPLGPVGDDAVFVGIVRLTDDFTVVSQVDLASVVDVSAADSLTIDVSADEDDGRARCLNGRADRIFLCDSARCERSGVLLI